MAFLTVIGEQQYIGLSTENLPENAPNGSTFHMVDTGETYIFSNGMWESDMRLTTALKMALPKKFGKAKIIDTIKLFTSAPMTTSGVLTSIAIDLNAYSPDGHFSLYVVSTGSGSIDITYTLSPDDNFAAYATPSSAVNIATAHTVGTDIYSFSPEMMRFMKIVFTEDGTNTAVVTAWLEIH